MPAASQQTWESHPLTKHTEAPFLADPTGTPSLSLPFCTNEGIRGTRIGWEGQDRIGEWGWG